MLQISSSDQSDSLSSQEIATQVQRIAYSKEFRRSKRMTRFLRLVVDRTLSGNGQELKEYVIATEVFDKHWTFDPRLDSIVRVEARRLRQKLQAYYRDHGEGDRIVIELQPGSYVPTFRERCEPEQRANSADSHAAVLY